MNTLNLSDENIPPIFEEIKHLVNTSKNKDENQTVGILLSTEKNETIVKYTLPEGRKNIFSSLYKLHLPTKEELIEAVEEEKKNFNLNN